MHGSLPLPAPRTPAPPHPSRQPAPTTPAPPQPAHPSRHAVACRLLQMFTKAATSLLRARLIIARVDLAVRLYPGVVAAPLLLGTLAGCGGRLLADAILWGWSPGRWAGAMSQRAAARARARALIKAPAPSSPPKKPDPQHHPACARACSVVRAELSNPAWVSRSALLAAAVYYFAGYHWALVPAEALAGLIITAKVTHGRAQHTPQHPST